MDRLGLKCIIVFILLIFLFDLFLPVTAIAVEPSEEKVETTTEPAVEDNEIKESEEIEDKVEDKSDTDKKGEQDDENTINEEQNNNSIDEVEPSTYTSTINKAMTIDTSNAVAKIFSGKTYRIRATVGSNKYLDIDAGKIANGTNLQTWDLDKNTNQQKFKITYSNGYYTITAVHSGKVLDVASQGKSNGTNVWQYENNGTDAQKWQIVDAGNNCFYIKSKCNGLFLDVAAASTRNGANLQMYEGNETNAQKFIFEEVKPMESKRELEDGIYKIRPKSGATLDINGASKENGANLQIWSNGNVDQQRFKVTWLQEGYYQISTVHTNNQKVLDVVSQGKTDGTNVWQYQWNNTDAQKWIIHESEEKGYYYVISKCNELYLDVSCGSSANATNVQTYRGNKTNAQKFRFDKSERKGVIPDGTYRISTGVCYDTSYHTNMVLDVNGASKGAGANIQIWGNGNVLQQKFSLTFMNDGYYMIKPSHVSGMALQVSGKNVIQNKANANSDAQLWLIENLGNNYYTIKSKSTGLYLDVSGASNANGANVGVYQKNGTSAQKWKIENVYFGIDVSEHQKQIDYNALLNSRRAEYMIARIGYSEDGGTRGRKIRLDEWFDYNYRNAKGKIPLGTYLYTYADTLEDAKNDAWALVDLIKSKGLKFELPIFFDIENEKQANLSTALRTAMCKAFCDILKQNGLKPGIYSNVNKLNTWMNMDQIPSDVSIWVAGWGYNDGLVPGDKYKYAKNHDIWQYSSQGTIDGISGIVDLNITFKKMW